MEPWALKAIQRWPNVPALFGWLSLDRRGRWLIKNELISRPQIIDTINANYGVDDYGRWYFQNGPQRGFMQLAYAPYVVHVEHEQLMTHTQQRITQLTQLYLDEEGSLLFITEHGPGVLIDTDLEWALGYLHCGEHLVQADDIAAALAVPSGHVTDLSFHWHASRLPVKRLDMSAQPQALGFERDPQPRADERTATLAMD
jgi:hypothetical protein